MKENSLEIKKLGVILGKQEIVSEISLKVEKGEFVSVVGKSGVGKTTLLNAIAGFLNYSGSIKKPKRLAMLFQNYSLFPWLTVEKNIAFGIESQEKKEALVPHLLKMIGLEEKAASFPSQLSGGQQQRVAFARALATEPELLLLDEPFGSLDFYTRLNMQEWLGKILQEDGMTIILVTHDIDEAIFLSDRVLVLKDGTLAKEFCVPFSKPRSQKIKYSKQFQSLKKKLLEAVGL